MPEEKLGDTAHMGIQGMIERVGLMGGTYDLQSAPGEGATVRAVFPALKSLWQEGDQE